MQDILFPYDSLRMFQSELIDSVSNALKDKKNVIIHAPTGLGKTVGVLTPALDFAVKNDLTVIFATPRHTQHRIAIETLREIKKKNNIELKVVDLIGKRHMCAQPSAEEMSNSEFYDFCHDVVKNKTCNFFNNIKNRDNLSLESESVIKNVSDNIMHVEELKDVSKSSSLCPFEIACITGKKARVIVADYHHVLSGSIRDNLMEKLNKELSECIIILDEAHNLPQKCRDLSSSQLSTSTLEFAAKECIDFNFIDAAGILNEIRVKIEELAEHKIKEDNEVLISKDELNKLIDNIVKADQLVGDLFFISEEAIKVKKRSSCSTVAHFIENWQGQDNGFTRFMNKSFNIKNKLIVTLNYRCLDPSLILSPISRDCYSMICMSGTLTPLEMYKDLFNINAIGYEFKNPFPKTNRVDIIVPDTTTKFTARNDEMFEKIAAYCASIVNSVPGNSIVFFPSYGLRDKINSYFGNKCERTVLFESPNLSKQEKAELIDNFKGYKRHGAVLLAVSSGSFGEGIDLQDNLLKCVIVVGIPLDRPDLETRELISYYDQKFSRGWDYGYTMPAIIKCLQNAGRCIRSESDKGVIIFLDMRYIWESYFKCFPKDSNLRVSKDPVSLIKEFFDNNKSLLANKP